MKRFGHIFIERIKTELQKWSLLQTSSKNKFKWIQESTEDLEQLKIYYNRSEMLKHHSNTNLLNGFRSKEDRI